MKKHSLARLFVLFLGGLLMQGCLDYDNPTDDFQAQDKIQPDVVYAGRGDSFDYLKKYTMEQVENAGENLVNSNTLPNFASAQYTLLGSKQGNFTSAAHEYQRQFSLSEMYAQYGVMPHFDYAYAGDIRSTYHISQSWNGGANGHFVDIKNNLVQILNNPSSDTIPEFKAMGLLLYDFMAAYNADLYGPFPYQDFKNNKQGSSFKYDEVKNIYATIVANIDTIVKVFNHFEKRSTEYKEFVQDNLDAFTPITQDAYKKRGFKSWIHFANSLKLRLAMHIVKVEPEKARRWAEEAVAAGVIEEHDSEFGAFPNKYNGANPIQQLYDWGDMRLSASFESMLKSLKHPYATRLYANNSGKFLDAQGQQTIAADAKVVGIMSGVHVGKGQSQNTNPYLMYSKFNNEFIGKAPLYLIKWSEVDFLRAEGALRGWNMGGTPEFFYKRGVENSGLLDYATTAGENLGKQLQEYYNTENAVEFVYEDPMNIIPNTPSVTKIGVKWNEGDSNETKLEKIITQKYIALFPNSFEAWTEMRRTGYPKVFPVLNSSDGDGTLKEGDMVRRMIFPNTDDASLKDIKETGLKALGGEDKQGTRLWWDVERANF